MENTKIQKPIKDYKAYSNWSTWCSENGYDIMVDDSHYYCTKKAELSLDELKLNKLNEINSIYQNKSKFLKTETPEDEVLTWDIQKIEAEAWNKDDTALTPFIDGLALARQVDRIELIKKILEKTSMFNQYMANLTGLRQYYEDRIKEALTIEDVEALSWESL